MRTDYTINFGNGRLNPPLKTVYQVPKGTSQRWRTPTTVYHPVTAQQYGKNFNIGDKVILQLRYTSTKVNTVATILNIVPYETARQVLASYNETDSFSGAPFCHVLVLQRNI